MRFIELHEVKGTKAGVGLRERCFQPVSQESSDAALQSGHLSVTSNGWLWRDHWVPTLGLDLWKGGRHVTSSTDHTWDKEWAAQH